MSERKHALFAPSSAFRWKKCYGSAKAVDACYIEPSAHSSAGTEAHGVLENLLINFKAGTPISLSGVTASVKYAYRYITDILSNLHDYDAYFEERLNMESLIRDCWGTADCVIYDKILKEVHIIDYKNGTFNVESEWNDQLILYAIGAMLKFSNEPMTYRLHILQPNNSKTPVSFFDIDYNTLIGRINEYARAAELGSMDFPQRTASEDCYFCPAKTSCYTFFKYYMEPVIHAMSLDPETMTDEVKKMLIEKSTMIEKFIKGLKEEVTKRLQEGEEFFNAYLKNGRRMEKVKDGNKVLDIITHLDRDADVLSIDYDKVKDYFGVTKLSDIDEIKDLVEVTNASPSIRFK